MQSLSTLHASCGLFGPIAIDAELGALGALGPLSVLGAPGVGGAAVSDADVGGAAEAAALGAVEGELDDGEAASVLAGSAPQASARSGRAARTGTRARKRCIEGSNVGLARKLTPPPLGGGGGLPLRGRHCLPRRAGPGRGRLRATLRSSIDFFTKASMSSGLRLVVRPWSVTTSMSTQVAPAF
jgi:hypothetical protein